MAVPGFRVSGKLYTATCQITMPFTGEVTVENADLKIKSIELQLVRVETCGNPRVRLERQRKRPRPRSRPCLVGCAGSNGAARGAVQAVRMATLVTVRLARGARRLRLPRGAPTPV